MKSKKIIIAVLLFTDLVLLVLGAFNLRLFTTKAGLPAEYLARINNFSFDAKNIYKKENIIEFDGKKTDRNGLAGFYLLYHKKGDLVNIKSVSSDGKTIERMAVLPAQYKGYELVIISVVTLFFFFTGIIILLRYRNTAFSYIIHALSISTGLMIISDWGDLITYGKLMNYILFLVFEASIYAVPTLFLHLSFAYPVKSKPKSIYFLAPFYFAMIAFIIISYIQLTKIFFFGGDVSNLYFLNFHTTIADVYIAAVIILTIARFEYSALTIQDITQKKQIYWALSGITFGPLIYVFLCLIPRLLMGHELVSLVFMQFTTLIAPVMLLISVTQSKPGYRKVSKEIKNLSPEEESEAALPLKTP